MRYPRRLPDWEWIGGATGARGGVEVDATALGFGPDSLGLTFPFPCSGAQISSTALQFGPLVSNSRLDT